MTTKKNSTLSDSTDLPLIKPTEKYILRKKLGINNPVEKKEFDLIVKHVKENDTLKDEIGDISQETDIDNEYWYRRHNECRNLNWMIISSNSLF